MTFVCVLRKEASNDKEQLKSCVPTALMLFTEICTNVACILCKIRYNRNSTCSCCRTLTISCGNTQLFGTYLPNDELPACFNEITFAIHRI
jgi:hypothetical protein